MKKDKKDYQELSTTAKTQTLPNVRISVPASPKTPSQLNGKPTKARCMQKPKSSSKSLKGNIGGLRTFFRFSANAI